MTQNGSTRARVFEAADLLLEQGIRPTQQAVREQIGSGSLTTINKALNDWWRTLGERITRQQQHPELPEPVLTIANQLWDRALAYAENRFEEQRQQLKRSEMELRNQVALSEQGGHQAMQELQSQNGRLLARCEKLADEKYELEQKLLKADEQQFRLKTEIDELNRKLRQQELIATGSQGGGEALIEARVRLSIQEEELMRLRSRNDELNRENAMLRQQLQKQAG
ncbi:DNA-binding protein [Marinobacterium sp. D7]|uniref:DNA-binding protein n=1 Tax=Marinobacterium ramblicola TaxID=2849041 RepID=UPI001C2CD51E|nr:DNA-binding protein [Marinobacterium ramblicola]MBV1789926.1 DNA-binding protein [Marinobacterium ramblicola]